MDIKKQVQMHYEYARSAYVRIFSVARYYIDLRFSFYIYYSVKNTSMKVYNIKSLKKTNKNT